MRIFILCLVLIAASCADEHEPASAQDQPPAYEIRWHNGSRYMRTDDRWYVWGRSAKWIAMPEGWEPPADETGER